MNAVRMSVFFGLSICLMLISARVHSDTAVSDATRECLECHSTLHPGIVEAWKKSRHGQITPARAIAVEGHGRKVSAQEVPEGLRGVVVGCAECHTLSPRTHKDSFSHNGHTVHPVVTPGDCGTCHAKEMEQFGGNLMAFAHKNLVGNSVYQLMMDAVNGTPEIDKGRLVLRIPNNSADADSCLHCHGTELSVRQLEFRSTDFGEMEFPVISGWPNQGVGRINPDGSRGACTACHGRHDFSMETARKPHTCKQCHSGANGPAGQVYESSKHGTIFASKHQEWNFTNVPWTSGKDFTAPTCAACHISLLADTDGAVIAERTHRMMDRLPWRIYGLIYAHPHPRGADTTIIHNSEKMPLPTDFDGGYAENFLMNDQERSNARELMQRSCLSCHDASWVREHWNKLLNTIEYTNAATHTATRFMEEIWKRNLAVGYAGNGSPFDETIEMTWTDIWTIHSNAVRYASAMGGGSGYGLFSGGRRQLVRSVREMEGLLVEREPSKE